MNNYQKTLSKKRNWIILIIIVAFLLFVVDLFTGPAKINISNINSIFDTTSKENVIFFNLRLPQSLTAIAVGLSLGLCGAVMQTILSNPLASPFTLGISSSASFGASLFLILGFPVIYVTTGALFFSLLATAFVYIIGKKMHMNTYSMVLSGIAIKFLFDSLLSLVQYKASDETLEYIVFWIFGSLNRTNYSQIILIFVSFLIAFIYIFKNSWKLTAMRFGEERAMALGVNTKKIKSISLILISIVTAVSVSFCGTIGFIGLSSPHIARKIVGEDQRYYLSMSALIGSVILLISSILSKTIKPGAIIPVGIISSLIGIPFLIYAIIDNKDKG